MLSNQSHLNLTLPSLHLSLQIYTHVHTPHLCTQNCFTYILRQYSTQHAEAFIGYGGPSEKSDAVINREMKDTRLAAE